LGKKVIVSFSIDESIFEQFEEYVRRVQAEDLAAKRDVSSRSSVLERILLKFFSSQAGSVQG
jgi:hypothetical protein